MRRSSWFVYVAVAGLGVACGGSSPDNLFGGGDPGAPSGDDLADASSNIGEKPPQTADDAGSVSLPPAKDAGESSSTNDAGSASSKDSGTPTPKDAGGSPRDAGPVTAPDASGTVDASPPSSALVYCGTDAQGNVYSCGSGSYCCATQDASSGQLYYQCTANAATCGGTPIACDQSSDCGANQACCAQYHPLDATRGQYLSVRCAAQCGGQTPSGDKLIRFCDPRTASVDCELGTVCRLTTGLPGYHHCE